MHAFTPNSSSIRAYNKRVAAVTDCQPWLAKNRAGLPALLTCFSSITFICITSLVQVLLWGKEDQTGQGRKMYFFSPKLPGMVSGSCSLWFDWCCAWGSEFSDVITLCAPWDKEINQSITQGLIYPQMEVIEQRHWAPPGSSQPIQFAPVAGRWLPDGRPGHCQAGIRTVSVMYSHVLGFLRFQVLDLHWSPVAPWSDCHCLACYSRPSGYFKTFVQSRPSKFRSESDLGRSLAANSGRLWKEQRKERGPRVSCQLGHSRWSQWWWWSGALSQMDSWARRGCIFQKKKKWVSFAKWIFYIWKIRGLSDICEILC